MSIEAASLNTEYDTATSGHGVHPVVLFDGVCNLCNSAVNFIIDRDPGAAFRFAPLQSEPGRTLTTRCSVDLAATDSLILVEGDRYYVRSTAALRIARRLTGAWPLCYGFILVPRPLRDWAYDWIARNRYRWFGKRETCRLPTPEDRARFLVYDPPSAAA